ncbi:hypothetical protein HXX76_010848 [Chlamydomonas incerta]|uniref:AAA+ ATPase domain-containing protein n=1 Tax=Chlamydomonas incerta TaxID=51695 RepID=A0A835SPV6_CHLIN|nr:hypothetical protein HXX76_010848 [Chlamydomonas incerta]|eukprot:KAG2429616.1 hypothetical protein HXX76_010848 [Chlamydomonas incerta]
MSAFGAPCYGASLVDGAAPRLPAGACWVALPPEALTAARMAAGQVILIGISARTAPPPGGGGAAALSPGPGARSPGPSTPGASSFGPAPDFLTPDPATGASPQPQSLWRLCGRRLNLPGLADRAPAVAASAAAAAGAAGSSTGAGSSNSAVLLGGHLMPARVWPASKLPRGAALLSPALREAGGQPPAGTVLLLYRPSAAAAAALAASGAGGPAALAASGAGGPAAPPSLAPSTPGPGGPAAAGAVASGQPLPAVGVAGTLVLRLCGDALLQPPAGAPGALDGGGDGSGGGGGADGSSSAPVTPVRTPAGKAGAAKKSAGTPATASGKGAAAAAASGVGSSANGDAAAGGPLQQWPLETLRAAAAAADEGTRGALAAVARRHLAGRHVLAGAPVVLPVLGSSAVLSVEAALPEGAGSGGGGAAAAAAPPALSPLAALEVSRGTHVVVLYPGEPLPAELAAALAAAAGPVAATAAAGAGSVAGGGGGGGSLARMVATAREAAVAAVAESAAEAAADAAERALRAGHAAGGVGFNHLGGVGAHLAALRELVGLPLRAPQLFEHYGIRPPRGVLLYGPPGSGKTLLARAAAADAGGCVLLINGPDVVSEYYGESESSLKGIFAAATALAPSVVIIDEIDALAPARGSGGGSDVASRLVTALLTLLDGATDTAGQPHASASTSATAAAAPASAPQPAATASGSSSSSPAAPRHRPVVVVAATNRPDALDAALRRPGRLERELEVGVPGAAARREVLQARLRGVRHSLTGGQVSDLAAAAHGFVAADLAALVDEAAMCALRRLAAAAEAAAAGAVQEAAAAQEAVVTLEDFKTAETRVRPSALREVAVEVPRVRWSDIGGLAAVKQALQEAVEWPHKAQGAMARLGAQPPRGVLLYGPPGCSKTLLARAVAAEAGLNFMAVKGGELVSKYVGESEKAIAALFARARAVAPAIIFFDELDGLVGSRGGPDQTSGGGGGVSERVLSQMLTEMDGLVDRGGVTVLAATNRPDCVDPALLRPGRFDRLIFVPLPDREARAEILRVHLRRTPTAADVDVPHLALATAGFSGADLGALVREAALAALEEDLQGATCVAGRHFAAALATTQPSVPPGAELMTAYAALQRGGGGG